jgi:hypothetical protein
MRRSLAYAPLAAMYTPVLMTPLGAGVMKTVGARHGELGSFGFHHGDTPKRAGVRARLRPVLLGVGSANGG